MLCAEQPVALSDQINKEGPVSDSLCGAGCLVCIVPHRPTLVRCSLPWSAPHQLLPPKSNRFYALVSSRCAICTVLMRKHVPGAQETRSAHSSGLLPTPRSQDSALSRLGTTSSRPNKQGNQDRQSPHHDVHGLNSLGIPQSMIILRAAMAVPAVAINGSSRYTRSTFGSLGSLE